MSRGEPRDREGERIGCFVVKSEGEPDERGRRRWNARFDCGARQLVPEYRIQQKQAPKSCGSVACKGGCRPKERHDGQR
jgi:hypothetical protein